MARARGAAGEQKSLIRYIHPHLPCHYWGVSEGRHWAGRVQVGMTRGVWADCQELPFQENAKKTEGDGLKEGLLGLTPRDTCKTFKTEGVVGFWVTSIGQFCMMFVIYFSFEN